MLQAHAKLIEHNTTVMISARYIAESEESVIHKHAHQRIATNESIEDDERHYEYFSPSCKSENSYRLVLDHEFEVFSNGHIASSHGLQHGQGEAGNVQEGEKKDWS